MRKPSFGRPAGPARLPVPIPDEGVFMRLQHVLAVGGLLAAAPAWATNGYFAHGYGAASLAIAGVGIALPQDALAAASNPAGTGALDSRADVGLNLFLPRRSASFVGNALGPDARHDGDGRKTFAIPELGFVRRVSPQWGWGLAVFGNGGMNTEYPSNPYARFGATGTAGVNLEQLFITPSVAWRPAPGHALGLALNVAVQRFSARGLGLFDAWSASPGSVSDRGTDTSTGAGLRLGWQGEVHPGWVLGATWSQKIRGRFERYRGLFADGGRFDVPENYGVGLAWQALPRWTVGFDAQRILYGEVPAVGNSAAALFSGTPLGARGGPGFGWRNITVLKLGLQWQARDGLLLRAGYSHAQQPVPRGETFFNVLAPGVVQKHLTFGARWTIGPGELNGYGAVATGRSVRGSQSVPAGLPPAGLGGGEVDVRLRETLVGVSYGWRF